MEDYYVDRMQRLENTCLSWLQKADQAYFDNDLKHCKLECQFLQQAIDAQAEMARISNGAEKSYHERKVKELNFRIAEAIREFDPDYFTRRANEKAKANNGGNKASAPSSSSSSSKKGDDISEEQIQRWIKDVPSHSFEDVTGMEGVKEKLRACIDEEKLSSLKDYLGLRKQKSYFFIGPPGCGKTYIIEAFAHELASKDYTYFSLCSADILSRYVGDAEKIITRLFEEVEKRAPSVLFIDEIDGVCKDRSSKNLPEYAASLTTSFLTGYNRIKSSGKSIIFLGATNYPGSVDRAMLDRVEVVDIPFPDADARQLKFSREFGDKIKLTTGFTVQEMASLTESPVYNYRDIERLTEEIKIGLMNRSIKKFGTEEAAINALKSGEFGIDRELFTDMQKSCQPSNKDSIVNDLKKWYSAFEEGKLGEG